MPEESGVVTVPKAFFGVPAADMLEVAREHQMEGVVAKRVDSPYREGRSPWWVKSPVRQTAELALVAFAGPPGRVGALLVAGYRDDWRALCSPDCGPNRVRLERMNGIGEEISEVLTGVSGGNGPTGGGRAEVHRRGRARTRAQ